MSVEVIGRDGGVGNVSVALGTSAGTFLDVEAYRVDFRARQSRQRAAVSWKLERRQHFDERGSSSWAAFCRGDEDGAAALAEQRRPDIERLVANDRARGNVFARVRVVEVPFTPYMRWELSSLRMQAECGVPVRVVDAAVLDGLEARAVLSEVVTLGQQVLYEVVHDSMGAPLGAVRFTDAGLIREWARFTQHLATLGMPVSAYLRRMAGSGREAGTGGSEQDPTTLARVLDGLRNMQTSGDDHG